MPSQETLTAGGAHREPRLAYCIYRAHLKFTLHPFEQQGAGVCRWSRKLQLLEATSLMTPWRVSDLKIQAMTLTLKHAVTLVVCKQSGKYFGLFFFAALHF